MPGFFLPLTACLCSILLGVLACLGSLSGDLKGFQFTYVNVYAIALLPVSTYLCWVTCQELKEYFSKADLF